MCENMEDQNESKVEGDEGDEMIGNSESGINMEANALIGEMAEEENQKKRIRHRRRKVYENIRSKMEFYFSDANLAKDRFLSRLIEENPDVDLAVFLQFNKIRELTDNIKDIKNALQHSELLSVSEDGTKVRRTKPIQLKENEDDCTIYVEKLPLEANHDWLVQVFAQYGTVDYVSIPKYRTTGKIKGFAFVEFHTPEDAQKTLEAFGAVGCCLASNIEPEKLCSIVTFDEENRNEIQVSGDSFASGQKRTLESSVEQDRLNEESSVEVVTLDDQQDGENEKSKKTKKKEKNKYKTADESSKKDEKKGKRKRKHTEDSDKIEDKEEEPSDKDGNKGKKKQKHVVDIINIEEEDDTSKDKNEGNEKQKHIEVTITSDDEEEVLSGKDEKKRKRKRKHAEAATKSDDEEDDSSGKSKKEKQIEVVDLEKNTPDVEKLNKRKRQVEVVTVEEYDDMPEKRAKLDSDPEKEQEDTDPENCAIEDEVHKKKKTRSRKKKKRKQIAQEVSSLGLQVLSKKEWKRLRNKYLNLQRITMKNLKQQLSRTRKWDARGSYTNGLSQQSEQMNEVPSGEVSDTATSAPRFTYTPGVIVRIGFDAPVTDTKKFKSEAKSQGDVQYVDVQECATEAFLRCSNAEAAKLLVSTKPWEEMAVLEGEDDKQYWARIQEDRNKMANRQRMKKRGKDKLLARAEKALSKHIKFDESL